MLKTLNISLAGNYGKPILLDIYGQQNNHPKPVVIFAHGFKGFKDWGHWSLFAEAFANAGALFIKFNFSHNGTTPQAPTEFRDLEAFGQNNFSIEYDNLGQVLDFLHGNHFPVDPANIDFDRIVTIGHSRGGPIVLLRLANDPRIKAAITWASVDSFDYAWNGDEFIQEWKEKGVYHVLNGRTGQQMPVNWQLYEDYVARKDFFDLEKQLADCKKPVCIIHGDSDPAVPVSAAEKLAAICPNSEKHIIPDGDHVFGGKHPFEGSQLPTPSSEVYLKSFNFLKGLKEETEVNGNG